MEASAAEITAVVQARAGDASAYGVLVSNHQEAAFRAAYLILRDAAAAEDVAQEALVRAYRELGRFREQEPFRPWLLRIVTNLALNEQRTRRRQRGLMERAGWLLGRRTEPPADASLVAAESAGEVWRAIERLDEKDRLVLYMRYFLELDEREMSVALGCAAGTVKSRLHRASRRLREVIEKEYPGLRMRDD